MPEGPSPNAPLPNLSAAHPAVIGRYKIDRLLARGGMAEVLLGRAEGPAGFSKRVVLKRIRPEFATDPSFVQMFLDEARLAAHLNHPNVVQVFDFGQDADSYYLAMEYIEGQSLRRLLTHLRDQGQTLPLALVCQVVIGVCEGLAYAHALEDAEGKPLQLVHRDVTPENILLSTNGTPKLVDFGIAKARHGAVQTAAGSLKGKFPYLPPEQVRGEPLDGRADVYALGVTLFEMLTFRRPFVAENELALLQQILHEPPPRVTDFNPALPPELADVVDTALARDLSVRYPSAQEMQAAVQRFAAHAGLSPNSAELARLVRSIARVSNPGALPLSSSESPPASASEDGLPTKPSVPPLPLGTFASPGRPRDQATQSLPAVPPAARSRVPLWGSLAATAILLVVMAFVAKPLLRTVPPGTPPAPLPRTAPPKTVPSPSSQPTSSAINPQAAQPTISKPVPEHTLPPAATSRPPPPPTAKSKTARAVSQEGFLTLRTAPWCEVIIDGVPAGTTPLVRVPLAAGKHVVDLHNAEAGLQKRLNVKVRPGQENKIGLSLEE